MGIVGALAGLLGQAGIYVFQVSHTNWYASTGFYAATAGTTLLIGTMLWETILWPILVRHDDTLLEFQGPIYTSKSFIPFFVVAGLIYGLGYILVGIGILRAGLLPQLAGILIAVGAPSYGLGALFGNWQVYVRSVGVTLLSLGVIWAGVTMLS